MGIVQVVRVVLECDGCQAIYGAPTGVASDTEARAAAYNDGWRFPTLVSRTTGKPMRGTSDVCPACAPDWKARTCITLQRRATAEEIRTWDTEGGAS
ncbi:hypothetical protein ACQEU3_47200 [Spirillospora sp. CA-253888]